jgi:hypothetical protein
MEAKPGGPERSTEQKNRDKWFLGSRNLAAPDRRLAGWGPECQLIIIFRERSRNMGDLRSGNGWRTGERSPSVQQLMAVSINKESFHPLNDPSGRAIHLTP